MNLKLRSAIAEVLGVEVRLITDDASVETIDEWDSLRHMNLIFAIEDAFALRFTDEEVANLTSVAALENAIAAKS